MPKIVILDNQAEYSDYDEEPICIVDEEPTQEEIEKICRITKDLKSGYPWDNPRVRTRNIKGNINDYIKSIELSLQNEQKKQIEKEEKKKKDDINKLQQDIERDKNLLEKLKLDLH